ncbi:hypothetical protein HPB51_020907 [Rhipicephalus microplus]|uniref:Uncharacterized protein n=1 Tax=Rhipicephalus microplus TaxID=6941 RepID=A0A9J6EQ27_RHIMP|nr:hypothetical protein HPB51_020907 [Rhipicephalus microplus]
MDLQGVQQTIVYLEDDSCISHLFSGASVIPESWKDVARLTLSLMSRWCAPFSLPPVMHQGYVEPIRHFFQTCVSRITELNLTAFHFVFDVDGCNLVGSTLPKFQALALTLCGVNHANSLESLARGCAFLELLDVLSSHSGGDITPTCWACLLPLRFTGSSFKLFQRKTRLHHLSIDENVELDVLGHVPGPRTSIKLGQRQRYEASAVPC